MCGLFSSVFKKIIPNNTTPSFQEVGGYLNPAYFVDGMRTPIVSRWPSQKWLTSTLKVILLFCLPLFSIVMNQNVNS